jgi:3-oxoacyl-[acyl-carrier-protein] synthase II
LAEKGLERYRAVREMTNALPAWIGMLYGFKGPSFTVSSGSSSGLQAVATAYDLIRWGMADMVIAGGADHFLDAYGLRVVGDRMKLLSKRNGEPEKAMRPFDKERDGFVLSDGGCVLVLESRERALKRTANVYAWFQGYGTISDPSCGNSPAKHSERMAGTMTAALDASGVAREEIGYVGASGVSTLEDDIAETEAIKNAFGKHAYHLYVSAPKSMIGHTAGASGALELAIATMALHTGNIPPTINHEVPDPLCDLNYVPNSMALVPDLGAAVVNSFGFAGDHCCAVLTRFPDH